MSSPNSPARTTSGWRPSKVLALPNRYVGGMSALRRMFRTTQNALAPQRRFIESGFVRKETVIEQLEVYYPSSWGYWRDSRPTIWSANEFPRQIRALLEITSPDANEIGTMQASELSAPDGVTNAIADAFRLRGSDKSSTHNYEYVYSHILSHLPVNDSPRILEIGLGSSDPSVMSTMGKGASTGASLRAFRDLVPGAYVFGGDIDPKAMFVDERIRTAVVDQCDLASFLHLDLKFGADSYDLVVDDGLHAPGANLNTVLYALPRLNSGGWLCIEDIPERSLSVWHLVGCLLPSDKYSCALIKCTASYAFIVRNLGGHRFMSGEALSSQPGSRA